MNPQFQPGGIAFGSNISGTINIQWFTISPTPYNFTNDTLFYLVVTGTSGYAQLSWDSVQTQVSPDGYVLNPLILNNGSALLHPRPSPPAVSGDSICAGELPLLTAGGADTLRWYYPGPLGPWVNTGTAYAPAGLGAGLYSYRVIGTNVYGCDSDPAFALLKVYPSPQAQAGPDDTVFFGNAALLNGSLSGGTAPFQHRWTPWALVTDSSLLSTSTASLSSTTTFTLNVTDSAGCTSTDALQVTVLGGLVTIDTLVPTALAVCEGDSLSIDLVVSGGSGSFFYEWMPFSWIVNPGVEDPVVVPDSSGYVYITVFDNNNLNNWAFDSLWITVYEAPERYELQ
ncbi:MAG TPA: hypothetical protein P5248_13235, partial [Bacteroidales bacterium]|nr:hypothetical protein [Bacteroidales bacterium]